MNKVTCGMAMSIDGFVAGPHQDFEHPFGQIPENLLHHWMFDEGDKHKEELDELLNAGAFIMGSNMFGPEEKRDDPEWKGWWGDNPPYHGPVFILSEKERDPIEMDGGTTFFFVTGGVQAALERAKEAAGDRNIAIAGGANTVNQYLAAGIIDELWLHVVPVTIGSGARLFEGVPNLKFEVESVSGTKTVSHLHYKVIK